MGNNGRNGIWWATALGVGVIAATTVLRKPRRLFDFKNKVVLITGGSRGLGLVLARMLADDGARLAICARNSEELERARQDLEESGAEVSSFVCDVRNQDAVEKTVESVRKQFGQIDVLINNAGVIQVGPLELQTQEDFKNAMDIHFWGPFYTMQAVVPEMRERRAGRIINIASIGGKVSIPHLAPYCASKFALVGLSGAMQVELAKENIAVTTVCPGLMRTGSHINAVFKGQNEKEFAWFSLGNALPVSSIGAERAAKQIIEASRRGDAEAIISIQAQFAAKFNNLFPELTAEISGLVNRILPAAGGIGKASTRGINSASWISPSVLTAASDTQSAKNNEIKPSEKLV